MNAKLYTPVSNLKQQTYSLWYSFAVYELLKPDPVRKGHIVANTGAVPVVVSYGLELVGLHPPHPVTHEIVLQPEQWYLGDVPEIIPLAAKCLKESSKFGIAAVTVTEFL